MERLKLETIENIIGVEKTTIEAFEKNGEIATLDKCILMGMEELKKYRIAEEQGLLLRLPCKVGDTVYILAGRFGAFYEEDICDGFYIGRDGILQVKVQNHKGNHGTYGVVDKTIFLTIEEAGQALARIEGENE